jgi:hypothetical protein
MTFKPITSVGYSTYYPRNVFHLNYTGEPHYKQEIETPKMGLHINNYHIKNQG